MSQEDISIKIEPSTKDAEKFHSDLLWLRSLLSEKSETLIGKNGKDFKFQTYKILYEIWNSGVQQNILSPEYPPKFKTFPDIHTFEVSYNLLEQPFEALCKIHVKRQYSKWNIFHL